MNVFFFFEILFVRGVTTFSSDCTGRNSLLETHRHVLLLFLMNSPEKEVLFNHRTRITHSRIIQCPLTNATKPMKQFYLNQYHVRSCYGTSRVSLWKLLKKKWWVQKGHRWLWTGYLCSTCYFLSAVEKQCVAFPHIVRQDIKPSPPRPVCKATRQTSCCSGHAWEPCQKASRHQLYVIDFSAMIKVPPSREVLISAKHYLTRGDS